MRRGNTPTHIFNIDEEIVASNVSKVFITYSQAGKIIVEKTIDEVTITNKKITTQLTQEDTLKFKTGFAFVQIRLKFVDGKTVGTKIIETYVEDILKDGEI